MPEPRGPRRPVAEHERSRSVLACASDGLPFRPYVWRGDPGPVIGARRMLTAREETMPDIGPGPEWYRERAAECAEEPAPPPLPPPPAVRCDGCGYLATAPGHVFQCG